MAGLGFVAVGDFAGDRDVGEVASEEVADPGGQFADREGAALGHEVELKLAHARFGMWVVAKIEGGTPPPPLFSDVWQGKDLTAHIFVCVAGKGVTLVLRISVANKGVTDVNAEMECRLAAGRCRANITPYDNR